MPNPAYYSGINISKVFYQVPKVISSELKCLIVQKDGGQALGFRFTHSIFIREMEPSDFHTSSIFNLQY
jgi:hypothetical protein